MKYFEYLPKFEYSDVAATNIMVRAKIREFVLTNASVYYKHRIEDGQRPDILSSEYYGNSNYTWLIFYANNIYDPFFDWPLTSEQLVAHVINKYGSLEVSHQTIHHYLMDSEFVVDLRTITEDQIPISSVKAVSVFENEMNLNEAKRDIVIIDQAYVKQIVNEMQRLFE